MPVLIAILSVIKYNFVSYIYKIRYFIAHSASIGISNINIPYIWNTSFPMQIWEICIGKEVLVGRDVYGFFKSCLYVGGAWLEADYG